jgi:hypothetical protein
MCSLREHQQISLKPPWLRCKRAWSSVILRSVRRSTMS